MSLVHRVLAGVVGVGLLGVPGVANADTLTRRDAVADVGRTPIGMSSYTTVAGRAEGDITVTRVTYGRRAVRVWIGMRELSPTTNGNFHRLAILSDRRYRSVQVDAFPGRWAGRAVVSDAAGRALTCPVVHRIDYDRNQVFVKLPSSCLGRRAHWVRVAIRTTTAGVKYAFTDDARTKGLGAVTYGPRVRR